MSIHVKVLPKIDTNCKIIKITGNKRQCMIRRLKEKLNKKANNICMDIVDKPVIIKGNDNEHSIILIIYTSNTLNTLLNIPYNSEKKLYLMQTKLYQKDHNLPSIKIPHEVMHSGNFKYKKFIKKTMLDKMLFLKKDIYSINLYKTIGKIHIYSVNIKNKNYECNLYNWKVLYDIYKINEEGVCLDKNNIYNQIYENQISINKLACNKYRILYNKICDFNIKYCDFIKYLGRRQ